MNSVGIMDNKIIFYPVDYRLRQAFLQNGANDTETNSSLAVHEMLYPQNIIFLLIVVMSIFILVTVLGNLLVIVAFIEDKRLRKQSNFFLLNLAICDFFIGAFCIPMYVPYVLTGKWMLGSISCKLWLVVDNLMCTASALSVVLISYDRFLSVTMAVTYHCQKNRHSQTVLKIIAVWVLSSLVYSPAILLWDYFEEYKVVHDSVCIPGYFYSWYFFLAASIFDFILPLTSISFFNLSIYLNIKIRSKHKRQIIIASISTNESGGLGSPDVIAREIFNNGRIDFKATKSNFFKKCPALLLLKRCFGNNMKIFFSQNEQALCNNIRIIKLSQDKKIAKSLSLLVCIFCVCWAPYSLLVMIRAACHGYCIDSYWYEITFWLLWINSSINPLLYPLCHISFRKAFIKVIKKWLCINKMEK